MRALLMGSMTLLLGAAASAQAADAPKVSVEHILHTGTTITGEKVTVPQNPDVVATIVTFPPGATLPIHRHPYPHYAYVLQGALTIYLVDTGKHFVVKQGSFLVETNSQWHTGKNEGTVPVKLLVIDQLPSGVNSNVIPRTRP